MDQALSKSPRQNSRWAKFRFCSKIQLEEAKLVHPAGTPLSDKLHCQKLKKIRFQISKVTSWWTTSLFNQQTGTAATTWIFRALTECSIPIRSIFSRIRSPISRTFESIYSIFLFSKLTLNCTNFPIFLFAPKFEFRILNFLCFILLFK